MSINTTMKKINNPWVILGLEPGATTKEVKLAYKSMALKTHPDKGGTIAEWLAVSDAYDNISKKRTRSHTQSNKHTNGTRCINN